MKTSLLLPLALLLTASACKKEKTELERLPAATQDGKNTAGFLLDGQAWTPALSNTGTGSPVSALWMKTSAGRTLTFGFGRSDKEGNNGTSFYCFLPHIVRPGQFNFNLQSSPNAGNRNPPYVVYSHFRPRPERYYYTGPNAVGSMTITRFDTLAHVVAGTFEVTVKEDNGSETHQLTQGRFDLTF